MIEYYYKQIDCGEYEECRGLGQVTRGVLAVCPELETWVAGEFAKETATLRDRREAREERKCLLKKDPQGGGNRQ